MQLFYNLMDNNFELYEIEIYNIDFFLLSIFKLGFYLLSPDLLMFNIKLMTGFIS